MRRVIAIMAACVMIGICCAAGRTGFNDNWLFRLLPPELNESRQEAMPGYDDSGWRRLTLPHDWAIEGEFDENNPSGTGGGALPGGVGWYRKHFRVEPGADEDERWTVDFDGAYMNATVYINGHELGTRPYGYAPFSYDITPWIDPQGDNLIAVRVDNAEQPNSRWYSGCGIYRNVWLRHSGGIYVPRWGQHVVADSISTDSALLTVTTSVVNATGRPRSVSLHTDVTSPDGSIVASSVSQLDIAAVDSVDCIRRLAVPSPRLWSPADPALYRVTTAVVAGDGQEADRITTVTGLRTIDFDAATGFRLNGERMKLRGVCLHHDAGALGAVVNRRTIERQLVMMKDMGVNAVRVSHNPPAPELLDVCDSLGLMVMDEAFDMWRRKKTAHDYARYFDEWHERDLTDLVLRDRNHPSVILWSIGNEVLEQWSNASADTLSLAEANLILNLGHAVDDTDSVKMSVNSLLTAKLAGMVRRLDPTRPVTAGCHEPSPKNHLFRSGALDVIGYNYHNEWVDKVPVNFPGKPFIITESVSGLMTRGYYRMPSDSVFIWPERWDKIWNDPSMACSSYDNCHVPWGSTHEETMALVESRDFVAGQFVWTGFDYLGEPTPYGWPARSSYFGIVDLAGFPKDIYYMYQSEWRPDLQVLHLFPHWSGTPGEEKDMWVYYNNADEVELLVNGVSQGVKCKNDSVRHVAWRVVYTPGRVEAVARRGGVEVARETLVTPGRPCALRLTPDRSIIRSDGRDLAYITAEVIDSEGRVCPDAMDEIVFSVDGAGVNVGVDNGSPVSLEPMKGDRHKAAYGKALLIVQSTGEPGAIRVSASAVGLAGATADIEAKR